MPVPRDRFVLSLGVLLLAEFAFFAIAPTSREDWLLENVLVVVFVVAYAAWHRRLALSRRSHLMIFLFLSLHLLGAHYTYSAVPYEAWGQTLAGGSLNSLFGWERNNFDRVVHFAYGLFLAIPAHEGLSRVLGLTKGWSDFFALALLMSSSLLYELIEWGAAIAFGGDLGQLFLGTQGDAWDAQKDMLLTVLGTLAALGFARSCDWVRPRGPRRDGLRPERDPREQPSRPPRG